MAPGGMTRTPIRAVCDGPESVGLEPVDTLLHVVSTPRRSDVPESQIVALPACESLNRCARLVAQALQVYEGVRRHALLDLPSGMSRAGAQGVALARGQLQRPFEAMADSERAL